MATAWDDINGRQPVAVPHSTGLSATSDEPLKPTRGHIACIAELSLRFPAARDTDSRQYQARLDFLANDTAHLAVPLLRAACDRVALTARGLPYASEIITAATQIVEERQRAAVRDKATTTAGPAMGDKAAAYALANLAHIVKGGRVMQTADGETFKLGDKGERRGIRPDGSTIEPWHAKDPGEAKGHFRCRSEDRHALERCYREYDADFRVLENCKIVWTHEKQAAYERQFAGDA